MEAISGRVTGAGLEFGLGAVRKDDSVARDLNKP